MILHGKENVMKFFTRFLGLLLSAVLAFTLAACTGSSAGNSEAAGVYQLTGADRKSGYIELVKDGSGTISADDMKFDLAWQLDGNQFSGSYRSFGSDQKLSGTLEDEALIVKDSSGTTYHYQKGSAGRSAAPKAGLAGIYYLYQLEGEGLMLNYGDLSLLEMTEGYRMIINEDGLSGTLYMGEDQDTFRIDLGKKILDFAEMDMAFEDLGNGEIRVSADSSEEPFLMYLAKDITPYQDQKSTLFDGMSTDESDQQKWWNGSWYGWWMVEDATGAYTELIGSWWDCAAVIEVDEDLQGAMVIYDEYGSLTDPISDAEVSVAMTGTSEHGTMLSQGGYFMDQDLQDADWMIDPGESDYADTLEFRGSFTVDDGGIDYYVILRRWGTDWSDVVKEDRPYFYEDWYLPLIESGGEMPYQIGGEG